LFYSLRNSKFFLDYFYLIWQPRSVQPLVYPG